MTDTVTTYIFLIVTRQRPSHFPLQFCSQINDVIKKYIVDQRYLTRDCLSFFQFCSMGRRDKSCSPALRQCLATECWLAKPGQPKRESTSSSGSQQGKEKRRRNLLQSKIHPFLTLVPPHSIATNISHDPQLDYEDRLSPAEQHSPIPTTGSPHSTFPVQFPRKQRSLAISLTTLNNSLLLPSVPPPLEDFSSEANDSVVTPLDDFPNEADDSVLTMDDDDFSYEADDSVLTMDMDNDLPCSCGTPTLQTLENLIGYTRKTPVKRPSQAPVISAQSASVPMTFINPNPNPSFTYPNFSIPLAPTTFISNIPDFDFLTQAIKSRDSRNPENPCTAVTRFMTS
ncbi:hypothetical protein DFJ58DRAFT_735854 [Suillus subalutaceus]|uniref:uncharacterized protein n=1 Tax=Suillus subalutaceus TaxID=48586 RepID=UPI001B881322|nr:uncharacterized protein DFJ58DRAFT_735854 [Suillus subalutaceus]KAG1834283.1 hypothetical protein DFJ58DRAFT_735854 [Suillus subalutaceus]